MDVASVIRQRLVELNLDQKALAAAAEVTESYVSQLLTGKKLPPAPDRTDLYYKIEKFLKIPAATLSKLATLQRRDELKRSLGDPQPTPLLREVRELILRKCLPAKERQMRDLRERALWRRRTARDAKTVGGGQESRQRGTGERGLAASDRSTEQAQLQTDASLRPRVPGQ